MLKSKSGIISDAGTAFEIVKRLSEATADHGGNDAYLRRILNDSGLVGELAKKIVSPVWDYVVKSVQLDVDWESSIEKFTINANVECKIPVSQSLFGRDERFTSPLFTDYRPPSRKKYSYRLVHYEKAVSPATVAQEHGVGGYRELCAFLTQVRVPFAQIIALDSHDKSSSQGPMSFVCARISDSYKIIRWVSQSEYGPDWFFLVRE